MPFTKPSPPVLLNVEVNWYHDAKKKERQDLQNLNPDEKWKKYATCTPAHICIFHYVYKCMYACEI